MKHKTILLFFLLISTFSRAQNIRLYGNINDTATKQSLPNVLLMAVRFSDSSLVHYARSNSQGIIKPIVVPIDTYLVILSHPSFSDKTYLLVPNKNDTAFNFKNVVMPPKSVELMEVEIIAYKEKSYYKGDTLIFTADSFKTRPNATVEELLRKLPGFRVDAAGKITIQGKEVDQVLVDGDEFFGADPTIATRNLNATSIANVQVYEKKNESTEEGQSETVKVLNLQMKEDAKKGYFGKVSGASDFMRFYEGELLLNKFKGKQKISLFGLVGNTPKQAFGDNDAYKYGLSGEQSWQYNDETGTWESNGSRGTGIPRTIKSGFYFNDQLSKKTKINTDYTYNQNNLWQSSETSTQFFLQDTNYVNDKIKSNTAQNESHNFNFSLTQQLDSLTELIVTPRIKYSKSKDNSVQTDDFVSEEGVVTRRTTIKNDGTSENINASATIRINRKFMKKDRTLLLQYIPSYNNNEALSQLNTDFRYYQNQLPDSLLVQEREQKGERLDHNAKLIYVEPLTKKFKSEINYTFGHNTSSNSRTTYDFTGTEYDFFNPNFSNSFENTRIIHRAGAKLIYDVKKYRVSIGSDFRNIEQKNVNLSAGNTLTLQVFNVLPLASFQYRISQGSNLNLNYTSSSQQPDLQQMQPVIDNTDPNRLSLGNPDLQPTFSNNVNLNYHLFKSISDMHLWTSANFNNTQNQISNTTTFDSLGRAVTQPINVNGNYFANIYFGGGFPIFKRFLKINGGINASHSNNVSFINDQKNITQNTALRPNLAIDKDAENYNVSIGGNYSYNIPNSTINQRTNQPYYTYGIEGNVFVRFKHGMFITTDGTYTNNGNRSPGYNLNFFIWNAAFGKSFLKTENLVLSLNAFDILNQNISNQRTINSNQIIDTKTEIIKRYFLLKLLYKFNNQKTKIEDEDF